MKQKSGPDKICNREFLTRKRSETTLGPTQSEESITPGTRVLENEARASIANGNAAAWVYGEIR